MGIAGSAAGHPRGAASAYPYRPDIDGLRAVAVLAVLVYHAFPQFMSGGFVGVDVFFVISGFLISGIIFGEIDRNDFSIARFYARRIRRIFPALSLVLITCLAIGWVTLLPDEFMTLGKHVTGGAGFVSNLVLLRESGYFDTAAEMKPLLHLWSLGIEEQYYLLWPFALAVVGISTRRRGALVAVVALVSFALNLAIVGDRPDQAFYLPFTRFWELMIGSGLALLPATSLWPGSLESRRQRLLLEVLSIGGLFAICGCVAFLDPTVVFPGWWALVVAAGTAAVILAGPKAFLNRTILSSSPMVFIGLISYPLYLWHWPIIVLGRLIYGESPLSYRLLAVVGSVGLAALTYRYVETPLRKRARSASSAQVPRLATVMTAVAAFGTVIWMGGIPPVAGSDAALREVALAVNDWSPDAALPVSADGRPVVLFIGDSHMQQVPASNCTVVVGIIWHRSQG